MVTELFRFGLPGLACGARPIDLNRRMEWSPLTFLFVAQLVILVEWLLLRSQLPSVPFFIMYMFQDNLLTDTALSCPCQL
jgi:hypothetical protein